MYPYICLCLPVFYHVLPMFCHVPICKSNFHYFNMDFHKFNMGFPMFTYAPICPYANTVETSKTHRRKWRSMGTYRSFGTKSVETWKFHKTLSTDLRAHPNVRKREKPEFFNHSLSNMSNLTPICPKSVETWKFRKFRISAFYRPESSSRPSETRETRIFRLFDLSYPKNGSKSTRKLGKRENFEGTQTTTSGAHLDPQNLEKPEFFNE